MSYSQINKKYYRGRSRLPHLAAAKCFTPKKNILDLSYSTLLKIFDYINDSVDYENLRETCKTFYKILEDKKEFDQFGYLSKIVYFKQHKPLKVEYYCLVRAANQNIITFLYRECYIKHKKKMGAELTYNYGGSISSKSMWKKGKLEGICHNYVDNQLVVQSEFLEGMRHGDKIIIIPEKDEKIISKYALGFKLNLKKFKTNTMSIDANFRNKELHGKTLVYFSEVLKRGNIKNILNFNYGLLNGTCLVHEHDRILKLNFSNGNLDGNQAILSIENKLRALIEYKDGRIYGRYAFFDKLKKVEEGYYYDGIYKNTITIFNPTELSKYVYPLKNNMIDGEYIERINLTEIRIMYKDDRFAGKYIMSDVTTGETVEINFFNKNNFEYRKYHYGKELIILRKKFGEYCLTIYNLEELENDPENMSITSRRQKVYLINFRDK